ncbi:MAG: peroxiredoxin-like family protein [Novosphingobium sp.]
MSDGLISALEIAVADARGQDAPLAARLLFVADAVRALSTDFAEAVDTFVARLQSAGAGENTPQVGDIMPDFMLSDQDGRMVTLEQLLETGPAVISFHRGHWCPYCRLTMAGMAEIEGRIAPHALVAISPERQKYTRALRAEAGATFPFLSDVGSGYALTLGLAVWVDDTMADMIERAGWTIPDYQGTAGWIMPIPAVFVVGKDARIIARFVDADYRKRMELEEILGVLKAFADKPG